MLDYDREFFNKGHIHIAGADECGRGCLAGPVAAAAVILPKGCIIEGLKDSKKLTSTRREALFPVIMEKALAVRVVMVEPCEIDKINILRASLLAMGKALAGLPLLPEIALIDGTFVPDITIKGTEYLPVKGGDNRSLCIAAASVAAKVTRDRLMIEYDKVYPQYGFANNKGYPTKAHYEALSRYGPCPIHRMTFRLC